MRPPLNSPINAVVAGIVGVLIVGFAGTVAIFAALMDGYKITGQVYLLVLLIVGGLNTAISLFYYLRVVKVMTIDPEATTAPSQWSMVSVSGAFIAIVTAPLLLLYFFWNDLGVWAMTATRDLF